MGPSLTLATTGTVVEGGALAVLVAAAVTSVKYVSLNEDLYCINAVFKLAQTGNKFTST